MTDFLFFEPGKRKVFPEDLKRLGVETLISAPSFGELTDGPLGKGPGVLFFDSKSKVRRYSVQQQWIDCGDYCMGIDPENPPTEETLRRDSMVSGHRVELADGCQWSIPMARSFRSGSPIPMRLVLGPDGKQWERKPLARFIEFSKDAETLSELFFDMDGSDIEGRTKGEVLGLDLSDYMRIVGRALNINYKIDYFGIGILGLVTFGASTGEGDSAGNLVECLKAIVDFQGYEQLIDEIAEEELKKKREDGSDSLDDA